MLELVETQRYAVLSQRATRQRWFGRSVAAYTDYAPRVDYGDEALRALMEPHLRKMRAARPTTDSSMTARILRYDAQRYALGASLREALGVASLETCACVDAQAKRALLAPLLDLTTRRPFQRAYDAWVCGVVLPALAGDASRVRYQRVPCVRAQCPGDMTLGPHCDAAYGHAPSTVIVSCLLTPAYGTNALIYESNPGREDWTAFEGSEGAALAFPGGLAAHFTSENTTGVTRWSIDARVLVDAEAESAYDAGSYFAVAERVGGAWRRVGDEIDAVDPRVGIPFDRT
jgi:hypothetical protein